MLEPRTRLFPWSESREKDWPLGVRRARNPAQSSHVEDPQLDGLRAASNQAKIPHLSEPQEPEGVQRAASESACPGGVLSGEHVSSKGHCGMSRSQLSVDNWMEARSQGSPNMAVREGAQGPVSHCSNSGHSPSGWDCPLAI